jgi:hypothetical protein
MADRYCRNCGQELTEDSRFCHSCGTPVHEAAHVPTPEADVPIPPPPRQPWDTTSATPPPTQTADSSEFRFSRLSKIVAGVAGLLLIFVVLVGLAALARGGGNGDSANAGSPDKAVGIGDIFGGETFTRENYAELVSDPDAHDGAKVDVTGQVFTPPEIVEGNTGFQMYVDPENSDMNTAVLAEGTDLGLEMNDYVHVIGTVKGSLEGKNAFGGKVSAVQVDASKVEPVNAVAVVDPTQKTVQVGRTLSDQGFSVTLKKIEFGKKTTRVYVSAYNGTGTGASFYEYSAKILQNSRQFDQETTFDYEVKAPQSELTAGVRTDGVVTFGKVDPSQPMQVRFEWYSENYNITAHPIVFQVTP